MMLCFEHTHLELLLSSWLAFSSYIISLLHSKFYYKFKFQSVQPLSCVWLFETPWTAARWASLSITSSQNLPKFMSIESVMPSNHLSLCHSSSPPAFNLHQSSSTFSQASGSFPMSQFFASGGQSIGASALASVLPMNIQDWFPLGGTGWTSFQSKGLSRAFSNTTVQNISSSALSFLYSPTLTSIHDYWKSDSFD